MSSERSPPRSELADATLALEQSASSLKLLVAAPFGPRFDNPHGGRVTAQLLWRLAARHRVALVYLGRPGEPPVDESLAARCELVREVPLPKTRVARAWRNRLNVLTGPIVGLPSSVSPWFSARFIRVLRSISTRFSPDVIQLEHDAIAYCAPWLERRQAAGLLVCHDPGARAAQHLMQVTTGRQRVAHRIDARVWRRYWRVTMSALDAAVVFTRDDAGLLESVVPGLRVETIPLGIDLPDRPLSATGTTPSVAFIGGYAHLPNADAALRLERTIMPAVRRRFPDLRLLLVGAGPTEEMLASAGPLDTVTGWTQSVEPYVDGAAVVALPIRIGGGMRVKLLESLAAGKAIVASRRAGAGLDLRDGQEVLLAESDAEFAAAIERLIGDPALRRRLGEAARLWALEHLSWESRVADYEALYASLLARQRNTSRRST